MGVFGVVRLFPWSLGVGCAQEFDDFIVVAIPACRPQLARLLHCKRHDFELDGLPGRVFDKCVTAVEIERPGNLPDAEYHRSPVAPDFDLRSAPMEEVQESRGLFVLGFHTRLWQDDVRPELLCAIVWSHLACYLGLRVLECQSELIETVPGQMKTLEHRPRDPTPAVIRAQGAVLHNHHPCVGQLDSLLARRDQNPEVGDSCFRPFTETLRNGRLVTFVHGVELAALCRGACADEPIPYALYTERPHRFLNFVFLVILQPSRWDIEPCDTNAGIKTLEERMRQLLLLGQSRQPLLHLSHLVDVERHYRHSTHRFSRHFLLLISVRQRTDKEAVAAGLFGVLGRKRGTCFRSGSRRTGPGLLV